MGWTWQEALHYKNGKVDRKAECDAYFSSRNAKYYVVEKSAMVGSVYYAAIRAIGNYNYKDDTVTAIPKEYQYVFAVVFLTSTNAKDVYNFGYKDMDETMLPFFYDCPVGILKLLSPTDNESANEWRKRCKETAERKKREKNDPNGLNNLPIGTVIKCRGYEVVKTAPRAQFKTPFWLVHDCNTYLRKSAIKRAGYEIVSKPA